MTPTIGSLCSGYGGLDLAVESVFGARTVWHCQYEPPAKGKKPKPLAEQAPSKILAAHWDVPNHGDLTTVDWTTVEPVDIIAAGYPCQPDSMAGKGLSEDDDRWIWPDIARAVGVLRPRYVVLENVQGHFVRGFRTVLGSLTSLGYDARWTLVRASDVGAPHRRERLFIVARDAHNEHQASLAGISRGTDAEHCGGVAEDADRAARGERWLAAPGQAAGWGARPDAGGRDRAHAADADRSGSQGSEPAAGRHLPDRGATADTERVGRDGRTREPVGCALGGTATAGCGPVSRADVFAGRWCACEPPADTDSDALREQPVTEPGRSGEAVAGLAGADPASDASCNTGRFGDGDDGATADTACQRRWTSRGDDGVRAEGLVPSGVAWGAYEPAIRRWERVLGRVAPAPTERGPKGGQRLSPRFVEWMMGLPVGWVTDVPISRNEQLKALGNGVVPQQAEAALRMLLSIDAGEVAA